MYFSQLPGSAHNYSTTQIEQHNIVIACLNCLRISFKDKQTFYRYSFLSETLKERVYY